MTIESKPPWEERYVALGRTQARYLLMLLILGIFFLALDDRVRATRLPGVVGILRFAPEDDSITVPFVQLPLSAGMVRLFGSLILVFLLKATLGTLSAAKTALSSIDGAADSPIAEAYDHHPNLIDMAVYFRGNPKWATHVLASVSYPLYLSLYALLAGYLSYSVLVDTFETGSSEQVVAWITQSLTLAFGVPTLVGLAGFWKGRLQIAWRYRSAGAGQISRDLLAQRDGDLVPQPRLSAHAREPESPSAAGSPEENSRGEPGDRQDSRNL